MTQRSIEDQAADNLWWRDPATLRYGAPEMLREKKATHPRRLRPLECDAFEQMHGLAKRMETFLDKIADRVEALGED